MTNTKKPPQQQRETFTIALADICQFLDRKRNERQAEHNEENEQATNE